jgi:hypothetical protein
LRSPPAADAPEEEEEEVPDGRIGSGKEGSWVKLIP